MFIWVGGFVVTLLGFITGASLYYSGEKTEAVNKQTAKEMIQTLKDEFKESRKAADARVEKSTKVLLDAASPDEDTKHKGK